MKRNYKFVVNLLLTQLLLHLGVAYARPCETEGDSMSLLAQSYYEHCKGRSMYDGDCLSMKKNAQNAGKQYRSCINKNFDKSGYPISNSETPRSSNSECPQSLAHLSSQMPRFTDPQLNNARQAILDTSVSQFVSDTKQRGISKSQIISMLMQQAEEQENTAQGNAKAAAEVSTYLSSRSIVTGVNSGRLSLSLPCSGSISMVEAAECAVIQQVWGAMANREIAKLLEVCW